jgi:lysozyme family protein
MPITDPRFLVCLPFVLKQEDNVYTGTPADWTNPRNFDNDPQDPGGATQCGLTHADYDSYCEANGLPKGDVRHIGQTVGETIYYDSYWLPFCPKLKPGLDLFFFDTNVNMGTRRAVMLLQASLGIVVDGAWGPKTDAAVAALHDTDIAVVIRTNEASRAATYRSFRTFGRFGGDWIRRDNEIGAESLKMVTT